MNEQYEVIHDEKLDALEDLVEQRQGSPMLALWQFRHELHRIRKRFGKHTAIIGENDRHDRELCELWNDGRVPVLFAHPTSIAHGLNLQYGGNALCWYSPTWNSEEREQTIRRLRRRGSLHTRIVEHFIIARGTIDELMVKVVDKKIRDQKTFLDALRSYRSKK
jgi:SNF2 family DNA or RNA helicase